MFIYTVIRQTVLTQLSLIHFAFSARRCAGTMCISISFTNSRGSHDDLVIISRVPKKSNQNQLTLDFRLFGTILIAYNQSIFVICDPWNIQVHLVCFAICCLTSMPLCIYFLFFLFFSCFLTTFSVLHSLRQQVPSHNTNCIETSVLLANFAHVL